MIMSTRRLSAGRRLFWAGLGCVVLTLVFFLGGFLVGNTFSPQGAVTVLLWGMVLSVLVSLLALVVSIAGIVAFPALRGRYVLLLVLGVLTSPLLWLVLVALLG